jgi:hypothetical protein
MFANIDYVGIVDYVIKALLGAAVWYGFKFLQDYYSAKMRHKISSELKLKIRQRQRIIKPKTAKP